MSQPAAPENLNIRVFTQSGSETDAQPPMIDVRSYPNSGHPQGSQGSVVIATLQRPLGASACRRMPNCATSEQLNVRRSRGLGAPV